MRIGLRACLVHSPLARDRTDSGRMPNRTVVVALQGGETPVFHPVLSGIITALITFNDRLRAGIVSGSTHV